MKARWNALTQPFHLLQTSSELPLQITMQAVKTLNGKIEELVHFNTKKPFLSNFMMLTIRATPFIIASQHSPVSTQVTGAAIAYCINKNNPPPAKVQTPAIKATHALALAFFISLTMDIFQNQAGVMSAKALIDASLTGAFLFLASKTEAPA